MAGRPVKHGLSRTKEYRAWESMRSSGFDVCSEWQDFNRFIREVGFAPSPDYQLRRLDVTEGWFRWNTAWQHKNAPRNKRGFLIEKD